MSHNYQSTTYNPPISAEERQRIEMNAAINRAIADADRQHRNEMNRLNNQHAAETASLNQQISQIRSQYSGVIRQHQNNINRIRANFNSQLQQSIAEQTEQREKALRQQRQYFDSKIERQEAQHRQDMRQLENQFNANISDLRQETQKAINVVSNNVNSLRRFTQQALQAQQKQINTILASMANAAHQRSQLTQAYNDQLAIVKMKNYQKYAPGQLQRIHAQLNGVDSLDDAAACAVLNTAFNNLLILDSDIEQARMEYEAKHLITLKTVEEILVTMNKNRNIPITINNQVITDERGKAVTIELDFWTEGKYTKLEEELKTIKETVKNGLNDPNFTTINLDKALGRAIQINQEQNQLLAETIERGNASQIRAEMADCVEDILRGQRFRVTERGYENNDARNAYIIKLDDGNSKIVVFINPVNNNENKVVIGTVVTNLSESDLEQQGREINEILVEEIGVDSQGGCCVRNNPSMDNAMRQIYNLNVVQNPIPEETKKAANL